MKKIFFALFLPIIFISCSEKNPLEENNRYQLISPPEGYPYLVDTKTGTVWFNLSEDGTSFYWKNMGTPPIEAKKKGEKTKELNLQ